MSGQLRLFLNRLPVKKLAPFSIIFISFLITGLLFISGILGFWDIGIYDLCIKTRVFYGPETNSRIITTIDITDECIELLGEDLDTRRAYIDILDVLSQVDSKGVVLDIRFKSKKYSDNDLSAALGQVNDSVIAALAINEKINYSLFSGLTEEEQDIFRRHVWNIKVLDKGNIPKARSFVLPFSALMEKANQAAHINLDPDPDGFYRRYPLLYEWNDAYIPSLALAAAVLYHEIPVSSIELKAGEYLALPLSENEIIKIPIDEQGCMLVPYSEEWNGSNKVRIPFSKIVKAKNDTALFSEIASGLKGRIAFIAERNSSQKDFGPVSFEPIYPLPDIHTAVLSGILNETERRAFIYNASMFFKILIVFLLLACSLLFNIIKKDALFHLGFFITFLAFSVITVFRWQYFSIAPWYALPAAFFLLIWAGNSLFRLIGRYQEQVLLKNALLRYFPSSLAQRIMQERKTELNPVNKELTILFADIAGFTKWSSDKTPEEVHKFLSEYLESMAEILKEKDGTVDKYMGDGIVAFFGDPFDMPDHCEKCVKAAIVMQEKILALGEKWKPLVGIDLKVRIGINTGKVFVGNLGSKTRIEYTVIGADVNLAQRMEAKAPPGGILVTSKVRDAVKGKFSFSKKRRIKVAGYDKRIEVYLVE